MQKIIIILIVLAHSTAYDYTCHKEIPYSRNNEILIYFKYSNNHYILIYN